MSGKEYELLADCTVAGILVQKLRSTRTGLVVCVANVEGPLVNGYFCLGEWQDSQERVWFARLG